MSIICAALSLFTIVVIVRIVLSWFPPTSGGGLAVAQDLTFKATEWCLGPLRRVLPPVRLGGMALDLSPMIVLIVVQLVQSSICR